jgi:DNA-binding MarR family transcriptional regulator
VTKPYYTVANFTGPNALGYLVKRLHTLMVSFAEAQFVGEELTFSHWVALVSLRDGLTHTCADIARHLNHDSGATTRLVDQLEERGLLMRERSKTDRRVVDLKLTPAGKLVAKALTPRMIDLCNAALEGMSAAEIDRLLANLKRLVARLEEMQPGKVRGAR